MDSTGSLPLPGVGDDLRGDIARWAADDCWGRLVAQFGGDPDLLPGPTADRLAWLDEFSERWDMRKGVERDQAGELPMSVSQQAVVMDAADRLGLRTVTRPRFRSYDHVVALGGLIRACFVRPAYAAELLQSGEVRSASFVGLGGFRPFSDEERQLAHRAGLDELTNELAALDAGVRRAFPAAAPVSERGEQSESRGGSWVVREYRTDGRLRVLVVAAPSSEPDLRRANTADAYRFMAEDVVHLQPGQRILAVTTALYVPTQHATAVRTLGIPYGVVVDTVGTVANATDGLWGQDFSATRYLMEIRSAIRAVKELAQVA